jgi:hypothetical protein
MKFSDNWVQKVKDGSGAGVYLTVPIQDSDESSGAMSAGSTESPSSGSDGPLWTVDCGSGTPRLALHINSRPRGTNQVDAKSDIERCAACASRGW